MTRRVLRSALVSFFIFLLPCSALAGGSIKTDILGNPLHWESSLVFNPDKGVLRDNNPAYDHNGAVQIMKDAFATWTDILGSGGALTVIEGQGIPTSGNDIDGSNFGDYFGVGKEACYDNDPNTPCFTPVVFDKDGQILDDLFGACAEFSILGFAGFDDNEDSTGNPDLLIVKRGQALFSGACLPDINGNTITKPGCSPCKRPLSDNEIRTVITHEVGHMMGMDHSQVNPDSYALCTGPTGCPPDLINDLPTMFPILVENAGMESLHNDDKAYFERLYGNPSARTCSVSGTVFASDGTTEVRGVEVVARNVDPLQNKTDALSFVSGAEAPRFNDDSKRQGNCKENCGDYLITGLADGQTYQLCVQKILAQFTGGSSIEPLDPPFRNFSNDCPAGLTVACTCTGGPCQKFTAQNITTDTDPGSVDKSQQDSPAQTTTSSSTGGCSLAKPARRPLWPLLQKGLKFLSDGNLESRI